MGYHVDVTEFLGYNNEKLVGKIVEFDIQPYHRGSLKITKVTERACQYTKHLGDEGWVLINAFTYDLEGVVEQGSTTNRLFGHTSTQDLAGQHFSITGVSWRKLVMAINQGECIVIARCG